MLRIADKTQFHIEYEFCPSCSGTFFDAGEFKDLSELTFIERRKKSLKIGEVTRDYVLVYLQRCTLWTSRLWLVASSTQQT